MFENLSKSVSLAYKKLRLQRLQIKALESGLNKERVAEQKEVFNFLIRNRKLLTSADFIDKNSSEYAKYVNVLTSKVLDDKKYERAIRRLKECQKA